MTFDPGSGHLEVLRRHVEKHDRFKGRTAAGSGLFAEDPTARGTVPTYLVASSEAIISTKRAAHFVCDGVDDEEQINLACVAGETDIGGSSQGFRVLLSEGVFSVSVDKPYESIKTFSATLQGMGREATIINAVDEPQLAGNPTVWISNQRGAVRDLTVSGGITTATTGVEMDAFDCLVQNCLFDNNGYGVRVGSFGGDTCRIIDSKFEGEGGITGTGGGGLFQAIITGNLIDVNTLKGISLIHNAVGHTIISNNIIVGAGDIGIEVEDEGGGSGGRNVTISDNIVLNSVGGIRVDHINQLSITDNIVDLGFGLPLELGSNGIQEVVITDNYLSTQDSATTDHAISVGTTVSGIMTITGNILNTPNGGYGIFAPDDSLFGTIISDNLFYECGDGGVRLRPTTLHFLQVNNNQFYSTPFAGTNPCIDIAGSPTGEGVQINGNFISLPTGTAIDITDCDEAQINDNKIWGPVLDGIEVNGCTRASVNNNHIGRAGQHGIQIIASSDCIISGNIIPEPGQTTTNTYDGIILSGDGDKNYVHGNKVVPKTTAPFPRYGVNVSASTNDDTKVGFNDLGVDADYGTGTVNDAGTGTRRVNAQPHLLNVGGVLVVGTGLSEVPMLQPGRVVGVRARVSTAPTGAAILVDLDKNNVTMYTTQGNRPTIADAAKDSGNATLPDIPEFVAGDYLSLNVDQIGSTIAGSDLVVQVLVEYL